MMKALFLGLPLHGHTNPSLPLVRALVERGDEVVYFSSEPFAAGIQQAGARYRPYRNAFLADPSQVSETDKISWLLMRTTGEVLAQEMDAFRAERPDYIISDSVAPWGQWAGQLLEVPVVTSVTTFAVNRHVMASAASGGTRPKSARLVLSKIRHVAKAALLGRRLRGQYGVRGTGIIGLMFGSSDLNIVYTSRHFQPCAESFDDRFLFIGPSIGSRTETAGFQWDGASQTDVIYISLGTLFNADPTFYRNCFEAFGGENVRVVMSIGTTITEASLSSPPANFVVKPWVPQLDVLRHASVFVSHGGMNSVSESLYNGVPLIVVPQMSEQKLVGRQVERLGAGVCLAGKEATADRLRQSVLRVLGDDRFRKQAALVRESFDAAGGAGRGADAILGFTRHPVQRVAKDTDTSVS
jgi:MGT family glycosyltransferase